MSMEQWDLYDMHGRLTGERYVRDSGEPFPSDRYHIVVEIYTLHRGELLVTKRDPRKLFGNMWEFTGGSVIAGEDSLTGAARELREETGIARAPSEFIPLMSLLRLGSQNWRIDSYAVMLPDDEPRPTVTYQEGETIDHAWLERSALEAMLSTPDFVGHVANRYRLLSPTLRTLGGLRPQTVISVREAE